MWQKEQRRQETCCSASALSLILRVFFRVEKTSFVLTFRETKSSIPAKNVNLFRGLKKVDNNVHNLNWI
jgi:hypothetical protein